MAKNGKKVSAFKERYSRKEESGRQVSWDLADESLVYRLVVAVSNVPNCAVLFGKTRDGGAWSLRFYEDGSGATDYWSDPDTLGEWLLDHVEWWEGYAEEKRPKNG